MKIRDHISGVILTQKILNAALTIYAKAWVERDPDLITTIFTQDAIYHERAFEKPHVSRGAIKKYWISKVVGEQQNISFSLRNVYVDGETAIVEWDAEFDNVKKGCHVRMREVAILEFEGDKIKSLREYWQSEITPNVVD